MYISTTRPPGGGGGLRYLRGFASSLPDPWSRGHSPRSWSDSLSRSGGSASAPSLSVKTDALTRFSRPDRGTCAEGERRRYFRPWHEWL